MNLKNAVIVAAARTAVGKAKRGGLATVRPDEMAAAVVQELLRRTPGLDPAQIEDVILGCAFPEGEQGMNMARTVALRAGLPESVCGETVNRYCSSGSQSIAHAAYAIMAGQMEIAIAGGAESMSMVPMTGNKFAPNAHFAAEDPKAFSNMGLTAENVAEQYHISRADQDAFALRSHQKANAAVTSGLFDPEIVPIDVETLEVLDGVSVSKKFTVRRDEGPRGDTTLEALAKLKPAFKEGGSVTAGNSSQTSDAAAAVIIMSEERAAALGLKPLARFVAFAVGGVPAHLMGIGPIVAIPKALKIAGLSLADIDLIELNEAFAVQSLAVIRELGLDENKVNVNGGAIALGHPLGCTGGKLTTQLIYEMARRKSRYGMVSMCIGGGMGAATIFENLQ
ncbi:MAG: acetyl-CoA C-acyltransferase [Anaerolineae bacterium CG_4_9_14_3_um_filter_57_17]|nr:acetyl-CoA C-acyltransferase [bacterium]NCT21565.1 acetyl-CoA C-acyltransferase [bacterium]OIO87263.1 MAG: acetyl-CoA acetyltransferase [Anaerolineae bacterium CG2_30_57_67]PJB67745.1 MAG: acetyl-CoA C-acyltransferase [Anaerolineae bacterium CG_4_9_14_3_um_filter_57_17]